jgi:hypothetical protein
MIIGCPIRGDVISSSNEAEKFIKIYLVNGKIDKIEEINSRDELVGKVDFFITPKEEYVFDFINEGAEPLTTPAENMNIDDIVNAFLFRELYSYASI